MTKIFILMLLALGLVTYIVGISYKIDFETALGALAVFISTVGTGIYMFYQGVEKESLEEKARNVLAEYVFPYLLAFAFTFLLLNVLVVCKVLLYGF